MSSQIDPVTGLPVFVPPPIEEPPFLNPPFPWKDLTGIDVPPRATYYGADGIPTIATVAGMNPQDNRGQTVNTDGHHALLVSPVGGASGGGIPVTKTFQSNPDFTTASIVFPLTIKYVLSFMISAFIDIPVGNPNRNQQIIYFLAGQFSTSPNVVLGLGNFNVGTDINNPINSSFIFHHEFANPIDPCAVLGVAPGTDLALYGTTFGWATGLAQLVLHYV